MKYNVGLIPVLSILSIIITAGSSFAIDSKTALYRASYSGIKVFAPKEELNEPFDLKKFLEKYNILPPDWLEGDEEWIAGAAALKSRAQKQDSPFPYEIEAKDLLQFLADAKSTIASFLLSNNTLLPSIEQHWIKKHGLRRLFTYDKLRQTIQENALTHVRLPRKVLIIRDKKLNQYVPVEEAPKIIDKLLKIVAVEVNPLKVKVDVNPSVSDDYEFIIFAKKINNTGIKFEGATRDELTTLVTNAPFDVGYDNIFSDTDGNAVIIDTEYKGEPGSQSVPKLQRYFK